MLDEAHDNVVSKVVTLRGETALAQMRSSGPEPFCRLSPQKTKTAGSFDPAIQNSQPL